MSRTAWSQARRTVWFGVSIPTSGRRLPRPGAAVDSTALQASVVGRRRRSDVTGSHFRQVCQTPFGAIRATNTSRPLAYCGGRVGRLDRDDRARRRNSRLPYARPQLAARPEPARVHRCRAGRAAAALTSKMSAKSESISISIVRRTGRRP